MIRFLIWCALLIVAAFACATVFWVSCIVSKDKRRREIIDAEVDGAIDQFERENHELPKLQSDI